MGSGRPDGTCATRPPITPSTRARPGSTTPGKALDHAHVRHTGSFPSAAGAAQAGVDGRQGVKVAFLAFTTDTERDPRAPSVVGEHRQRRAGPRRCQAREEDGRGGGDRQPPLGRRDPPRVPAGAQLGTAGAGQEATASPLITAIIGQGPHAVQPIERINDKFVRLQRGQPDLQPEPGLRAPGVEPGRDGRPAPLRRRRERGARAERDLRPVFVNHPDYVVLPIGDALRQGRGRCDPAARLLSAHGRAWSGRSKSIQPVPPRSCRRIVAAGPSYDPGVSLPLKPPSSRSSRCRERSCRRARSGCTSRSSTVPGDRVRRRRGRLSPVAGRQAASPVLPRARPSRRGATCSTGSS